MTCHVPALSGPVVGEGGPFSASSASHPKEGWGGLGVSMLCQSVVSAGYHLFRVESPSFYKLSLKQIPCNFRNVPVCVKLFKPPPSSSCIICFHFGLR